MKRFILTALAIFFLLSLNAQKSDNYRDFDFCIGSWKVYKTGTDSLMGYSKISSILSGYAISENYESSVNNYKGTSLSKYNPVSKLWEQFWVDNNGSTLYSVGSLVDDKMVLRGELADSLDTVHRITWQKLPNGNITQVWESSTDNGTSWDAVFNKEYRRRE